MNLRACLATDAESKKIDPHTTLSSMCLKLAQDSLSPNMNKDLPHH
jgi:hypothetical protein